MKLTEFQRAMRYANGLKGYADAIVQRWNDCDRPERRRIVAGLRAAKGPMLVDVLAMLPTEITSKL